MQLTRYSVFPSSEIAKSYYFVIVIIQGIMVSSSRSDLLASWLKLEMFHKGVYIAKRNNATFIKNGRITTDMTPMDDFTVLSTTGEYI